MIRKRSICLAARVIAVTGLLLALFVFAGGCDRFVGRDEPPLVLVMPKIGPSGDGGIACGYAAAAALALRKTYGSQLRVTSVPEAVEALDLDSLRSEAYHERVARRVRAELVILLSAAGPSWRMWRPGDRSGSTSWQPLGGDWRPLLQAVRQKLGVANPTSGRRTVAGTGSRPIESVPVPATTEARKAGEWFLRAAGVGGTPTAVGDDDLTELVGWAIAEGKLRELAELRHRSEDVTATLRELGELLTNSWRDTASSEWALLRGAYLVQAERWSQAERWLSVALRRNRSDGRVYYWLARLHPSRLRKLGIGDWERSLRQAIQLNPLLFDARLYLADLYFHNQRSKYARRVVDDLLRINPVHEEGLMMSGRLYIATNDIPNTLRVYKQVLDLNPRNADAYYNLGIVYFHTGHLEDAEKLFRRAIEINGYPDAHLYLGLIYEKRGKLDSAIAEYRTRIRLRKGPDDAFADQARRRLFELLHAAADSVPSFSR